MATGDVITLGIGTPAGITPFILIGLSPGGTTPVATGDVITLGIGTPAGITPFILIGLSSGDTTPLNIKGPARHDLAVYRGDTLSRNLVINQGGSPVDIAGWTFTAQVRTKRSGIVTATFTVNVTSAVNGALTISLPSATTAILDSGVWDLNVAAGGDTVGTLLNGVFTVTSDVSRS